ncbi:fluoride efflux transporter CrcB [Haloarcula sebkhae]|uniref:Fluoride efflux transporter CrcB n=2 Tax=Haloarcula sebkhae TaxID=932660 RepID=A0ACC6VLJ6_9EURY|nr:fluoride efflux transporter CrcB [Haloarcula sebkhae]GGK84153.1 chromosome condensation protein CrcB [Haloarcula sebkhae]
MEPAHLVGTGGALGAVARYTVGQLLASDRFPFSTLAVNVVGSFALGLVVFAGLNSDTALLVGTGACGSFTTYSSFSVQSVRMWETGDRLRASMYALGTLGLCLTAAGVAAALVTILQL